MQDILSTGLPLNSDGVVVLCLSSPVFHGFVQVVAVELFRASGGDESSGSDAQIHMLSQDGADAAKALCDEMRVTHQHFGETALQDEQGVATSRGPFYIHVNSNNRVELYNSRDHAAVGNEFEAVHAQDVQISEASCCECKCRLISHCCPGQARGIIVS